MLQIEKKNSDRGHSESLGEKGAEGVRETGEKMAGVGVLKRWEKGELKGGGITQQGLICRNRKSAKGRNKPRIKVREPVMQGKWSGRFGPIPRPVPHRCLIITEHC